MAGADQASVKNTFGGWCIEKTQTLDRLPDPNAQRVLSGVDGIPKDKTGNLSRPREWTNMNSSALLPTITRPCPERRGMVVGCFYLETEGQSWLSGDVDRGLMKIDQLRRLTQTKTEKYAFLVFFPWRRHENLSDVPKKTLGIFGSTSRCH